MSTTNNAVNTTELVRKPAQLRVIFILNALMMFLPFVFYYLAVSGKLVIAGLKPMWMIYTAIGYMTTFAVLVTAILKRNIVLLRIIFGVNVLIAFPAGAFIGMLVAVISFALSFNSKVKGFFASTGKIKM